MRRFLIASLFAVMAAATRPARAQPWFDSDESALEDRYAEGDFDEEDHVAMHLGGGTGTGDVHGESWVSVALLDRSLRTGKNDFGAMLLVGLALDRLAAGPVHRIADPPSPAKPAAPEPAVRPTAASAIRPSFAHDCVAAAWRASGLGADDGRIESIIARSRASALLPETRVRAMRLWTDANRTTSLATTDGTNTYDAVGANLVLELRLTWRLDRLAYAGDEPALERARLERFEARSHLAERTLQGLFAWARAQAQAREAVPGSEEEAQARLRVAEAEATLEVLTGGWFSEASGGARAHPSE